MKIYRVVPDTFMTRRQWNNYDEMPKEEDFFTNESILYELGYASFLDRKNAPKTLKSDANSFCIDEKLRKSFFLFPQDAIETHCQLIGDYSALNLYLLEYDIPIEELYKYVGYGVYNDSCDWLIEFSIPIGAFRGKEEIQIKDDLNLSKKIEEATLRCFKDAIKSIDSQWQKIRKSSSNRGLEIMDLQMTFQDLIKDNEYIDEFLKSPFYQRFISTPTTVIQSGYLTGNIINIEFTDVEAYFYGKISIEDIMKKGKNSIDCNGFLEYDKYRQYNDYLCGYILGDMGFNFRSVYEAKEYVNDDFYEKNKDNIIKTLKRYH
jgi:hypothetical protein